MFFCPDLVDGATTSPCWPKFEKDMSALFRFRLPYGIDNSIIYFVYIYMLLKMVAILDKVRLEEVTTQLRLTDQSNMEEVIFSQKYFEFSKMRMTQNRKSKAVIVTLYLFSRTILDLDDYGKYYQLWDADYNS